MDLNKEIGKGDIEVRQNLALFCNLVSLILSWNCVKSLVVTKITPKKKFRGAWGNLGAEHGFQRQSWKKYMRETLDFL